MQPDLSSLVVLITGASAGELARAIVVDGLNEMADRVLRSEPGAQNLN